ncbi:ACT domain-containing protein [Ferrimonas marina]|uniref:CASTOR ACT domain-containing protein n=1 Tax=Ferrimonas marina TaxID=299255 RepID=A0A1M5XYG4_9GAMM|nr:ACT domain-containing protein [Ferrimonas marina]SHI04867.1 hypothetical protein SAMN02745129_3812 [Ferrimonas marina]
MHLTLLPTELQILRLPPHSPIDPAWLAAPFFSLTRTDEELSLVLPASCTVEGAKMEPGWRALKVAGPLDFSLVGILAQLSQVLADAGVSLFALSTFDTDYLLVKAERLEDAIDALQQAGHQIDRRR